MFQSSLYSSDHPQAKAALSNIYELFTLAVDERRHALTYVCVTTAEGNDLLVEGFFVEPFKLSTALGAGTAQLIVPRLLRYFDRNQIFSMTLMQRLQKVDLVQFVDTVVAAALKEVDDLGPALEERGLQNIRLTFQGDVVKTRRELHWRTQLALTRLSKDLHQIPLLKDASDEEIARVKHQLIDDV
ncbi:MAG: hypothetical protein VB934_06720, partial [Polyangiaceae bacterium]